MMIQAIRKGWFIPAILLIFFTSVIQAQIPCGTMPELERKMETDLNLKARWESMESNFAQQRSSLNRSQRAVVTIPVIVHVIHNSAPYGVEENITDEQILSQIQVLNEDFRRQNPDAAQTLAVFQNVAADSEIEFCLATRTPDGLPTTGINRIVFPKMSWTISELDTILKPQTIWNRDHYLNLWSVNLVDQNILGYSQFPLMGPANADGVVVHFRRFGRTGNIASGVKGRTATHEVGHWFNLRHIWGDGDCSADDFVSDTPLSDNANYGCPLTKQSCGSLDMVQNYMDYTDDDCQNIFTAGQKDRMHDAISLWRPTLLQSTACQPFTNQHDAGIAEIRFPVGTVCTDQISPAVRLVNFGQTTLTSVNVNYKIDNGSEVIFNWQGDLAFGKSEWVFLPVIQTPAGNHVFDVYTRLPNGQQDQNPNNDNRSSNFFINSLTAGIAVPFMQTFEVLDYPPPGWSIQNPDGDNTWVRVDSIGGFGKSSASVAMNMTDLNGDKRGRRNGLISPEYDLSKMSFTYLEFEVAYARRSTQSFDSLLIFVSPDCGQNWLRIWGKAGTALATAMDFNGTFIPDSTQWRKEILNISGLQGSKKVSFKFETVTRRGNVLYLDNINVGQAGVGVQSVSRPSLNLKTIPNPASAQVWIEGNINPAIPSQISIMDITGRILWKNAETGSRFSLNLEGLPEGLYFIQIVNGDQSETTRIIKQ